MTTHTDCTTALQARYGNDDTQMLNELYQWVVHEIEVVNELVRDDDPARADRYIDELNTLATWIAPPHTQHHGDLD